MMVSANKLLRIYYAVVKQYLNSLEAQIYNLRFAYSKPTLKFSMAVA